MLKTEVIPIVKNQSKSNIKYLEVWQKVFQCMDIKEDCSNILHLIELVLIVPFTNTKAGRLFSRMNLDWPEESIESQRRRRLSQNWEEGVAVDAFNPDPISELWLSNRVRHLKSALNKSSKRVKAGPSCEGNHIDLDEFTMSSLENSGDEFLGF